MLLVQYKHSRLIVASISCQGAFGCFPMRVLSDLAFNTLWGQGLCLCSWKGDTVFLASSFSFVGRWGKERRLLPYTWSALMCQGTGGCTFVHSAGENLRGKTYPLEFDSAPFGNDRLPSEYKREIHRVFVIFMILHILLCFAPDAFFCEKIP